MIDNTGQGLLTTGNRNAIPMLKDAYVSTSPVAATVWSSSGIEAQLRVAVSTINLVNASKKETSAQIKCRYVNTVMC
jgi:hypothetical protein